MQKNVLTSPQKKDCVLIKKETYNIPLKEQKEVEIFKGSQIECLGKFHGLSSFSFEKNNIHSYTQYFIREC